VEFVEYAARALYSMEGLCARYGISGRMGYNRLARLEAGGGVGAVGNQRRVARGLPQP